jgi:hypothetical protein
MNAVMFYVSANLTHSSQPVSTPSTVCSAVRSFTSRRYVTAGPKGVDRVVAQYADVVWHHYGRRSHSVRRNAINSAR